MQDTGNNEHNAQTVSERINDFQNSHGDIISLICRGLHAANETAKHTATIEYQGIPAETALRLTYDSLTSPEGPTPIIPAGKLRDVLLQFRAGLDPILDDHKFEKKYPKEFAVIKGAHAALSHGFIEQFSRDFAELKTSAEHRHHRHERKLRQHDHRPVTQLGLRSKAKAQSNGQTERY